MRFLSVFAVVLISLLALPVHAQVTGEATARTRELATAYVEQLDLERLTADTYESMNEAMPEWERLQREMMGPTKGQVGVTPMPSFTQELDIEAIRPFLSILDRLLIETYARVYTEQQLEAMIRFDSSRAGQSISTRRDDFIVNLLTVMIEQMPSIREELGFDMEADEALPEEPSIGPPTRGMRPAAPMGPGIRPLEVPLMRPADTVPPPPIVQTAPE